MGSEVVSGAANGAMMGASFGPVGMAVGAVIGGIMGRRAKKKRKKQQRKLQEQQRLQQQQYQQQYCQQGSPAYGQGAYGSQYAQGGYGREPMDAPTPFYNNGAASGYPPYPPPMPSYPPALTSTAPSAFGMSGFGSLYGQMPPTAPVAMPAVAPVMALPQQYTPQYAQPTIVAAAPSMGQAVAPAGAGVSAGVFNNYGTVNINVYNNAPFGQQRFVA